MSQEHREFQVNNHIYFKRMQIFTFIEKLLKL